MAKGPTAETTTALVQEIAKQMNRHLLKKGYFEEFEDTTVLAKTEELFVFSSLLFVPNIHRSPYFLYIQQLSAPGS